MTQQEPENFEQFMKRRQAAARAYVRGDSGPVVEMSTRTAPATFFAPLGGTRRGAGEVIQTYQRDATMFTAEGDTQLEILQTGSSSDIGYWVGLQHAVVRMQGADKPMAMDLRVTEIFRRAEGVWMLVHRHADTLVDSPKS